VVDRLSSDRDMPAASIVKLLELKPVSQISDEMLVMADVAQKARVQWSSSLRCCSSTCQETARRLAGTRGRMPGRPAK